MTADPALLLDGDFVLVRMALVDQVGWPAAAVLQRIHWRCQGSVDGTWRASHAEIATEVRMSERSVERSTKQLRDAGWLEAGRAAAFDATTIWSIPGSGGFVPANLAGSDTANLAGSSSLLEEEEELRARANDDDPAFAAFWRSYPRRVGKGAARKAFEKAVEKVAPSLLISRAEAYAAHVVAAKVEEGYVKHPSTWLNQECWSDELPRPKAVASPSIPSCWR